MENNVLDNMCQSCAMPLKDDSDYGTNADSSVSKDYCKFCFQNGAFIQPDLTMADQIAFNVDIVTKMGMPKDQAEKMMAVIVPTLKRWQ